MHSVGALLLDRVRTRSNANQLTVRWPAKSVRRRRKEGERERGREGETAASQHVLFKLQLAANPKQSNIIDGACLTYI